MDNLRTFNDKRNPIWSPNKNEYQEGEDDFAQEYIVKIKGCNERNHFGDGTLDTYIPIIRRFLNFYKINPGKIKSGHISEWLFELAD